MAAWNGSVESGEAEQEHFPVAAQGHALPREMLTIHICSHHLCFIIPFSELPSQDFCHLFSHPPFYLLAVSSCLLWGLWGRGACGWEVVACRHQANGRSSLKAFRPPPCPILAPLLMAGQACASTLLGLCGAEGRLGHHWGRGWTHFLPLLLWLQPAAEGQSPGAGGNDISSTADVCSVDVSQSNFPALCYLSGSSLISPFCPFCRWGVSEGALCPSSQVSPMQNEKEIVASLPPGVILLRIKPILAFCHLSE